jgi:hypothetical protein
LEEGEDDLGLLSDFPGFFRSFSVQITNTTAPAMININSNSWVVGINE